MSHELNIHRLIEQEPELQISVRAAFLQKREGKWHVLLALHGKHDKWMLPGGRIEQSELQDSIEGPLGEALLRELKEELGYRFWDNFINYDPLVAYALGKRAALIHWKTSDGRPRLDICMVFAFSEGTVPCIPATPPADSEISTTKWVPLDARASQYFPNTTKALRLIPRILKAHPVRES